MLEMWVQSLCRKDPLVEENVTHSSIPAGKISWMEEPGRLQSAKGLQRVGYNWACMHEHIRRTFVPEMNPSKEPCKVEYECRRTCGVNPVAYRVMGRKLARGWGGQTLSTEPPLCLPNLMPCFWIWVMIPGPWHHLPLMALSTFFQGLLLTQQTDSYWVNSAPPCLASLYLGSIDLERRWISWTSGRRQTIGFSTSSTFHPVGSHEILCSRDGSRWYLNTWTDKGCWPQVSPGKSDWCWKVVSVWM